MNDETRTDTIRARLAPLYQSAALDYYRHECERAQADPKKYRLSLSFAPGCEMRYRFVRAGTDGRKRAVRFCYSRDRNAAGYFLIWRERFSKTGGERDQWDSTKDKCDAIATVHRLAREWREARS